MKAIGKAGTKQVFEPDAGADQIGWKGIDVSILLIAHDQPILIVKDDKAIGDRLDRRTQAHFGRDVDGQADTVAITGAPILKADPSAGLQRQFDGRDVIGGDAVTHGINPGVPVLIQVQQGGNRIQQITIGHAGGNAACRERVKPGTVGKEKPVFAIKHGKTIADDVDRGAQAAFSHDRRGVGAVQIAQIALVLALQARGFGLGGTGRLPFFHHQFRKRAGLQRQLFIGGGEFAAFPFQMPFGGHPGAAFLRQSFCRRQGRGDL